MKKIRSVIVFVIFAMLLTLFPPSSALAGKQGGKRGAPAAMSSSRGISAGYPALFSPSFPSAYASIRGYPYYPGIPRYRWWGPGYYWGWCWGWPSWYWGWGWPSWYWGWGWPSSYWWWGPGIPPYSYYRESNMGKVKTKVKPREAKVYVNGHLVGLVDDFDGLGQDLYLRTGEYMLIFRSPGYTPYVTDVFVRPRKTTKVKFKMEKGEDVLSEEVQNTLAALAKEEQRLLSEQQATTSGSPERSQPAVDEGPTTYFKDSGRLILTVLPVDASIYIDGNFWGSLEKTRNKLGIIRLAPGEHLLEISRPGHTGTSEKVVIVKDEDLALNIRLAQEVTVEPDP